MKTYPITMDILRGCHHIEQRGEGTFLQRCPESVCELYKADSLRMLRIQCPSGIRIIFKTNSTEVKLHYSWGRPSREVYGVSVFCDGVAIEPETAFHQLSFQLDGGMHTVEIMPPHLVECYFQGLELDEDAVLESVPAPEKELLFVGDSIMQGMTTSKPALAYAERLARYLGVDYTNGSIAGITVEPQWARLIADEYEYNTVLIAIGINDYSRGKSLADYTQDLKDFVAAFSTDKKMILFSMLPCLCSAPVNSDGDSLQDFRDAVQMIAEARPNTIFVDGLKLVPAEEKYFIDQLHPNDPGAEMIFENLKKLNVFAV